MPQTIPLGSTPGLRIGLEHPNHQVVLEVVLVDLVHVSGVGVGSAECEDQMKLDMIACPSAIDCLGIGSCFPSWFWL